MRAGCVLERALARRLEDIRMASDALDGFDSFPFTHAGETRTVYALGSGPGVVVMH
jgi:hypothetical protein